MTNTRLLREHIVESGYRTRWLAQKLGISYQCFLNKIENKSEFKAPEMKTLSTILNLTGEKRDRIFFAEDVDELSTN